MSTSPGASQAGPGGAPEAGKKPQKRPRRRMPLEGPLLRIIATAGTVGIGVAIAAIMRSQHSQGWLIGLVVAVVAVVLSALVRRL
jgi:hypothetical protein